MSQLAAINGKPILQYYTPGTQDDETEQALCINDKFQISFSSEESLLIEADRLIHDEEYRNRQGERLKNAMLQPEQFDRIASSSLMTNVSQMNIMADHVDYRRLEQRWYALETMGFTHVISYMYSLLDKKNRVWFTPRLFLRIILSRLHP